MAGLEGQVALVTGAGGMRGVGRATALKLASQGADLVITDVPRAAVDLPPAEVRLEWNSIDSVAEEVRALGRQCLPLYTDLGYSEQIQQMVGESIAHFGHIDILVNNARAIIGQDKVPVTELEEEVWRHFLDINTTAVFLCTKFVGREMVRQGGGGRIVNIASNASKQASAMGAAYSSSKFAVLGLTQASALDLAPYGITVNSVCPGPINTDRMSYWERSQAQEQGMSQEEFRARIVQQAGESTPLGRIAEAEDVANMVAFLTSEDASFITGQAYNVNGGILFH
jgi:3-oxoacyl-[acyl-carrier protein] reductase/meso-butanediol dehydrogenase/(S,S)-butanediol dehydrogenase/diacetyl reductase